MAAKKTVRQLVEDMSVKLFDMDDDIKEIRRTMATKVELQEVKSELMSHIDAVYKCVDRFDQEMTAHHSRTDRIDGRLTAVERHVGLA